MMQILFIQIITLIFHSAFAEALVFEQIDPGRMCHFNVVLPDAGITVEKVFEFTADFSKNNNIESFGLQSVGFHTSYILLNEKLTKGSSNDNLHRFLLFETGVSPPLT